MSAVISISGLIGSGKDSIADYLIQNYQFEKFSFAGALKDAVAVIFHWDRTLLEGATKEARAWREQVDVWWAKRLGIPHLTPRWVLQYFGTDVCRKHFHDDIWLASLEKQLLIAIERSANVVVTDSRFPNELALLKTAGATMLRVHRGPNPEWYDIALATNAGLSIEMTLRSDVHPSEWSWIGYGFDFTIDNNSRLSDLYSAIRNLPVIQKASKVTHCETPLSGS